MPVLDSFGFPQWHALTEVCRRRWGVSSGYIRPPRGWCDSTMVCTVGGAPQFASCVRVYDYRLH